MLVPRVGLLTLIVFARKCFQGKMAQTSARNLSHLTGQILGCGLKMWNVIVPDSRHLPKCRHSGILLARGTGSVCTDLRSWLYPLLPGARRSLARQRGCEWERGNGQNSRTGRDGPPCVRPCAPRERRRRAPSVRACPFRSPCVSA